MEPQSDQPFSLLFPELLALARQAKGEGPLGELLQECWPALHSFAARRMPLRIQNKVSPDDVVQEGMYAACRCFKQFLGTTWKEWRCWLFRIVRRLYLSFLWRYRRRKRNVARERSLDADPALQAQAVSGQPTAVQVLEGTEARQALDEAIAGLPPDQQEVLSLRHDDGLTIRETAARLETSEIKVRRTDKKALANLLHSLS